MMRLPYFRYHAPRGVQEAADLLSAGDAMIVATVGGVSTQSNLFIAVQH